MKKTCEECYWYSVLTTICHRYPPTAKDYGMGAWTQTNCDDWCGEFKPIQEQVTLPINKPHQCDILSGNELFEIKTETGQVNVVKPVKKTRTRRKKA